MPHRPRLLIALSLLGAVGFVVLRVLYRAFFGGAGAGETLLWQMDTWRPPGPFAHIAIGGTVTAEGLAQAALSAIPFAATILVIGAVVALWDPRRLILVTPTLRVGQSVALAGALALAIIPGIIESALRVRTALSRRGLRPGLRGVIPVLERTIERALGFALALESRGLRGRVRFPRPPRPGRPLVNLVALELPSRGVGPVNWAIQPGQRIVLTGATGSGKTSVLETIAGVVNLRGDCPVHGQIERAVDVVDVAFVPHSPHSLFLTSRVFDEVMLGLVVNGSPRQDAQRSAQHLLEQAGLAHLMGRRPDTLSTGEAAMVALVAVLAPRPAVIVLDEPLTALSEGSRKRYLELLESYGAENDATILLTDHPRATDTLPGFESWQLVEGGVVAGRYIPSQTTVSRLPYRETDGDVVLRLSGVSVSHEQQIVLDHVNAELRRGEMCVLVGDNGAGKSSLLEAIARGATGVRTRDGIDLCALPVIERARIVALVPPEPGEIFITSSLEAECRLADAATGNAPGFTRLTLESILPGVWRENLAGAVHPRDLSRGQQVALAIALQLSLKPLVIALDEPLRGLDESAQVLLAHVLACVVETGTAVLVATHHRDSFALYPHRTLELSGTHVIELTQQTQRARR